VAALGMPMAAPASTGSNTTATLVRTAIPAFRTVSRSRAVLARTNSELLPAAAVAVELGLRFQAGEVELPLDDPGVDQVLAALELAAEDQPDTPLLVLLARLRETVGEGIGLVNAMIGWAPRFRDATAFAATIREHRSKALLLRRTDANLTLATAHGTKGLEFDHVIVLQDADRFPSRRALDEAADRDRALEEERRLAYVAWTRARRSFTLLYDPAAPSKFLLEAFSAAEVAPDRN